MASGLFIDKDGFEDFYLDPDDVDECALDEWKFVREHQYYIDGTEDSDKTESEKE